MKRIHIKENSLANNFNKDLEPMSDFEKDIKDGMDYMNSDEYKNAEEVSDLDSDIDQDDEYSKNFIIGRLFEAQQILMDLIDYLENSDYAIERGGELFKKHLEKVNRINNELEHFWDE